MAGIANLSRAASSGYRRRPRSVYCLSGRGLGHHCADQPGGRESPALDSTNSQALQEMSAASDDRNGIAHLGAFGQRIEAGVVDFQVGAAAMAVAGLA